MRIRLAISLLLHEASKIKKTWIWIGLGFVAGLATHIYYVQEMLAALTIFSVLFVGASIAAVAIFVLVRASKPIIAWATPNALRVAHGALTRSRALLQIKSGLKLCRIVFDGES